MEYLSLQGTYHRKADAGASIDKTGAPIPKGLETSRIQIGTHDDRLFIKAVPFGKTTTTQTQPRFLPIKLNNGATFLMDSKDFMLRMQVKEKKLQTALQSQENFDQLLAKRAGYLAAIDDFSSAQDRCLKAIQGKNRQKGYLPTCDPYFPGAFSQKILMKIFRIAHRRLLHTQRDTIRFKVKAMDFLTKKQADGSAQISMFRGISPCGFHPSHLLGDGFYSETFAVFDLNGWSPAALKISRPKDGYQEHAQTLYPDSKGERDGEAWAQVRKGHTHLKSEFQCVQDLYDIHQLKEGVMIGRPTTQYEIPVYKSSRIATLWPRYACDLEQLTSGIHKALPRIETFSKKKILEAFLSLLISAQKLHEIGVVYGDYKLENILCTFKQKSLTLTPCDFGDCQRKEEFTFTDPQEAEKNIFGTTLTINYCSEIDLKELSKIRQECLTLNTEQIPTKTETYFKIIQARNALSLALIGYQLLGYGRDWPINPKNGCIDFSNTESHPTAFCLDKKLYGKKIYQLFNHLLVSEWRQRLSIDSAITTIKNVLKEAKNTPDSLLAQTLSQNVTLPGPDSMEIE